MILLGAGGHAKVIFDILQRNNIEVESFYVDESSDDFLFGKRIYSYYILYLLHWLNTPCIYPFLTQSPRYLLA